MVVGGFVRRAGLSMKALAGVMALVLSLGASGLWPLPSAHAAPVSAAGNTYVPPTQPSVPAAGAAVVKSSTIFLDSSIKPANVSSVTFLDNQNGAPTKGSATEKVWDAGVPANGVKSPTADVKGWAKQNGSNWDVYYGTTTQGKYPSLPADSSNLFNNFTALTKIENLDKVSTSGVTNMYGMFNGCSRLTSLDVLHFDTSQVTNMMYMFGSCSGLTSLDVSHFDTSKVTNMALMFQNCSGLTSLDVSHFDTSNVTNMFALFDGCKGLTTLDVSHFDTSKVSNMSTMFNGCSGLSVLDVSHFDTAKVTNMMKMFQNCSGLSSLNLSSFDTALVTNKTLAFSGMTKLSDLQLGAKFTLKGSEVGLASSVPDQSAQKTGYTNFKDGKWHDAATGAAVDEIGVPGVVYTTFRPNTYTVHFNGNAPQGATVTGAMADQPFTYDLAQALSPNAYRRVGYTLLNWNTQSDGAGAGSYADGQSVQNLTATDKDTVNLYAQWAANTYTVRFEAGADDATGAMADQPFTYDVKQALSANGFARKGYAFAGWRVKNSVSMLAADPLVGAYADKAEVMNLTAEQNGVVTLVAQWTKNAEPSTPSNPSTKPSNPSSPSASGSGTASADTSEASTLADTGAATMPAVVVALMLVGVAVPIGMLRKRA